jgi:hypothetical protein
VDPDHEEYSSPRGLCDQEQYATNDQPTSSADSSASVVRLASKGKLIAILYKAIDLLDNIDITMNNMGPNVVVRRMTAAPGIIQ